MAISFVNGFLCECSCDVAKAKKGVDPHPKGGVQGDPRDTRPDGSRRAPHDSPAVTFGGSLARLSAADALTATAVDPTAATSSSAAVSPLTAQGLGTSVDLFA